MYSATIAVVFGGSVLEFYVFDKESQEPVGSAEVHLYQDDSLLTTVQTRSDGHVRISDSTILHQGEMYRVVAGKMPDYLRTESHFMLSPRPGRTIIELFVQSSKAVIELPEVRFNYDKWTFQINDSVNSLDSLRYLYDILVLNPEIVIKVRNHSDCRGSDMYSSRPTQRRAQACVEALIEMGIDQERLIPVGMGEEEPRPGLHCEAIARMPTKLEQEIAHQRNRRTDAKVISTDFKKTD